MYNILIVDDEKSFCHYLSNYINMRAGENYNITVSNNGEQAVDQVSKAKYDLILLDIIMPGIDGTETLRRIKQICPKAVCVMMSCLADEQLAKHAIAKGAIDYITKPIDLNYLVNTVLPVYSVFDYNLKWTADFRLGIPEIDALHRQLFSIANELLNIENPIDKEKESRYLLDHLRKQTQEHFLLEEEYMRKIKYPEIEGHLRQHKDITEKINNTIRAEKDLYKLKNEISFMLYRWLKEDIYEYDKKFAIMA